MARELTPIAFMSYVRFDDEHQNGRLSRLCELLSGEVQTQTGHEFPIFQDRKDIKLGENWRQRIESSLDQVMFLIPVITPSFFRSKACRDEFLWFLKREKKLKRNDLILPIYYVSCPALDEKARRARNPIAKEIASRQYADWRELRSEPFDSPQVRRMLSQLASHIRDALHRIRSSSGGTLSEFATRKLRPTARVARGHVESLQRPSPKTEPPIRVVDSLHRGDHLTITEAIERANSGDRILVRQGLYEEGLIIDKPLEIIGDGEISEVIVQAKGKDALLFKTTMGRVTNLTLRQIGGGNWCGVDISQGRLELEGCDITSQGWACIAIHGGADPRLRRNRIHDGKQVGVSVYDNGQGTLEENDIFGNAHAGVKITTGGNPTLHRNRIHDGRQNGILVGDNGQGTLEHNDIFENGYAGIEICTGGNPTIRHNRIYKGKQNGVLVVTNGLGILEDNKIFNNAYGGVGIRSGGDPTLRHNHINNNGHQGVWVYEFGGGTIEDNDLRGNGRGAWEVSADSEPKVKRARNLE